LPRPQLAGFQVSTEGYCGMLLFHVTNPAGEIVFISLCFGARYALK